MPRVAPKQKPRSARRGPGRPPDDIPRRRMTLQLPEQLASRLDDYAYWEGVPVTQALSQILIDHFRRHRVKPRPKPKDLKAELEKLER